MVKMARRPRRDWRDTDIENLLENSDISDFISSDNDCGDPEYTSVRERQLVSVSYSSGSEEVNNSMERGGSARGRAVRENRLQVVLVDYHMKALVDELAHVITRMANDPLEEILQFLKPDARIDLKHISLDHLLGISGTEHGLQTLLKSEQLIQTILELTEDKEEEVSRYAIMILVNVSANAEGASELLKYRPNTKKNIVELLLGYVIDQNKKYADAACMILSNITRVESNIDVCLDTFMPHLNDLLNIFLNLNYNQKGSKLHYIAPIFSNLSCSHRVRKWLTEENPFIPLIKLLPFCNYMPSAIRRGGAIGTVRNLSFDTHYHNLLLSNDLDLLTYLLPPIMGNEEYDDEEMEKLPISLQYLPKEKQRDIDIDIRKMVIETLNKLCAKRHGREVLRNNGVYYVLREYHKWEQDPSLLLVCENVVDILIQKEDEVGAEDLSSINVPEDMTEKFRNMDEEYLKSAQ